MGDSRVLMLGGSPVWWLAGVGLPDQPSGCLCLLRVSLLMFKAAKHGDLLGVHRADSKSKIS